MCDAGGGAILSAYVRLEIFRNAAGELPGQVDRTGSVRKDTAMGDGYVAEVIHAMVAMEITSSSARMP